MVYVMLISERFSAKTHQVQEKQAPINTRNITKQMTDETRQKLQQFFEPFNDDLAGLLGYNLAWN